MAIKDWPGGVISKTPVVPGPSGASGVWTLDQVAYWTKQNSWPYGPADPYFYDVSLLLTGDGTNGAQNNTFLDSSTNNFTITRNGNTTQGTFSPYGNLWSNYFDGTGDYLNIASNAAFGFGTGDLSIEFWAYIVDYSRNNTILDTRTGGSGLVIGMFPSGAVNVYAGGDRTTASGLYPSNQWCNIVVTRSGSTLRTFINGVLQGYFTGVSTDFGSSNVLRVGYQTDNANYCYGYISNLRICKGSIPTSYQTSATSTGTSVFTPSTTPLTTSSQGASTPSVLTCQSNRFIDNSSNAFAITVNGNTSVQRFSPFNPTAPYSTSVIGGSGYFDGNGDYLATPSTGQFAPTGDFTIGLWFYPIALPTYSEPIGNYTGNNATDWLFEIPANGTLRFYTNGATIRITSGSGVIKIGQWHYIALCRSGTTITGYLNGTSIGTYTQSGTFGSANKTIYIGQVTSTYSNGYISDIKLIDGSAVTTVPTAPQTATTGTKMLLNMTNAGIPDAAMMNDLETVGNAQVSTSVKKYGTGSLAFDGTGDWLKAPTTPNCSFETGDFTLEGWIYPTATTGTDRCIWDTRASAGDTGMVLFINSTGNLSTYTSASIRITSSGTVTANTWQHIALVRSSGTLAFYINGTQSGTLSYSTTITCPGKVCIAVRYDDAAPYTGYIDDLRITKGYARYTANFTPPAAALPTY